VKKGHFYQKPEQMKGKPRDCSSDQIKKCLLVQNDHPFAMNRKGQERQQPSD